MTIILKEHYLKGFIDDAHISTYQSLLQKSFDTLTKKTGEGKEFLGWLSLPSLITKDEIDDIKRTAEKIRNQSEAVIFIGIGGSYLGARAVIDAINGPLANDIHNPKIYYAGHNISSDYTHDLLTVIRGKEVSMVVISKSGTTTEPAIAFRILKKEFEKKYGASAKDRIVAITDKAKGALRTMANSEGYKSYVIPDDVGGRFSVLTPVGLLPIAIAGIDISKLVTGARAMEEETRNSTNINHPLNRYAVIRNALYAKGKKIEIMANFEPGLHYLTEWWKQLYGESEGKDKKAIFPAGVDFTTDLHSMGQWIQDGERSIFETFLIVEKSRHNIEITKQDSDLDELNYLSGKGLSFINYKAYEGTALAHFNGGVPSMTIEVRSLDETTLGELIFFFEKACGLSGYMLGVNPFNQPGVEEYKKNMFKLLNKPGY